jgi:transposase-like protein
MRQRTEKRKVYTAEEKLRIVKEHLIGKKPVSQLCEAYGIVPSQFYKWQQTLFENGAQCLEKRNGERHQRASCEVQHLRQELEKTQARLANKHEVLSELMSEHIALKKGLGD